MTTNHYQENLEDGLKISDFLHLCLYRWKWFVLSIICCVALAIFYIKTTPPVYVRTASVLIKEDENNSANILAEFSPFQSNSNVNNEIISFQSLPQMEGVVQRLGLNMNYRKEGRFHDVVLYGKTLPVNAAIETPEDGLYAAFTMRILEGNRIELSDFILGQEVFETNPIVTKIHQKINTPIGKVVIEPTPYYFGAIEEPIYVSKSDIQSTARAYASRLGASLHEKECTVVDLSFSDVSPQRAGDVLNTLIEVYNENWVKDRNQVARSTSEFITKRLIIVEEELGMVESDISDFKSKTLLPSLDRAADIYLTKSDKTSAELTQLYNRLSVTRYLQEYMVGSSSKTQLLPANSGIESSGIEGQISEYNEMILRRNTLVAGSSEANPLVQDIDQALDALHKAILVSVNNYIVSLNTQIASLEKVERKTNSQLAANPTQAKYLLSVERQQKIKEQLYTFLLQKREENELTQTFTAHNTRIIQPAMGSDQPAAPAKSKILLIAFALGLILPAGIIFLRESINNRILTRQDLKGLTAPFLGEIPQWNSKEKKRKFFGLGKKKAVAQREIVVRDRKRNTINEAFRVLRTNIEFMVGTDKGEQVILLTSFRPGSGKTFVSSNLGSSLAIKGKRVLIIDGDLRKASLSKYINSPKLGIADYLTGNVNDINKIIQPIDGFNSYEMIPVGTIPPNPTELLCDERFIKLIEEVRKRYDYILIDCPPIDIVADTQVMEQCSDRTFFLVRSGLLEKEMIPSLEAIYQDKRFKNLSVILNGISSERRRYGYGYGYYSRYGYSK